MVDGQLPVRERVCLFPSRIVVLLLLITNIVGVHVRLHSVCRRSLRLIFNVAVVMHKPGEQADFQRAAEATGQSQRLVLQARHGFGPQHGAFTGKIINVSFFAR